MLGSSARMLHWVIQANTSTSRDVHSPVGVVFHPDQEPCERESSPFSQMYRDYHWIQSPQFEPMSQDGQICLKIRAPEHEYRLCSEIVPYHFLRCFFDPFGFGTDFLFFFAHKYDWMILVKLARDLWAPKRYIRFREIPENFQKIYRLVKHYLARWCVWFTKGHKKPMVPEVLHSETGANLDPTFSLCTRSRGGSQNEKKSRISTPS